MRKERLFGLSGCVVLCIRPGMLETDGREGGIEFSV